MLLNDINLLKEQSMANKAIKYRLYPTTEQRVFLAKTFGCCRKVYNLMLADKITHYRKTGGMLANTPAMYKKDYPFLKEVDSLALANEQLHLQAAYKNFFRDKAVGFPKFKSAKHTRKSYTTNNQKGSITVYDNCIKLPKIGRIKAAIHRKPDDGWILKSVTVSQDSDERYYASVLYEYERPQSGILKPLEIVGLDYKSDGLYMDSEGKCHNGHKYFRMGQVKLAKQQRKLKHKTIGSNNYIKQQLKISRIHKHIKNQRLDDLHKTSTEIANQYDAVCVESLNMRAMSNKGFGNGKATMDNGYGMFLNMLEYKLSDRGKYFVKVDKWYPSSQICSHCERRKKMTLGQRVYKCECGLSMDRDLNAAINIKNEGIRILREAA